MLQIAMHAIRDRKANVLVIGADNARAVICKLFQELEFPNVVYDRSIKLAQHRLKTEIFQLVVFDTFYAVNGDPTSDLNGIVQFLRTTRTLASAPLTIVLSPAPRIQGLKAAYAEGLLASPICASVSAATAMPAIQDFLKVAETYHWDPRQIAFDYLYPILAVANEGAQTIATIKTLLEHLPSSVLMLARLAETQFASGDELSALASLAQAALFDTKGEYKAMLGGILEKHVSRHGTPSLGLNQVAVIDNDDSVFIRVKAELEELGAKAVTHYSNSDLFWADFSANLQKFDLIIQEWQVKGSIKGIALIQRIRSMAPTIPLVILSSLVKPGDKSLLFELGMLQAVIEKPVSKQSFAYGVSSVVAEVKNPDSSEALEKKIFDLLAAGKTAEAERFQLRIFEKKDLHPAKKALIEAVSLYHQGDYDVALVKAKEALNKVNKGPRIFDLLGKIFLQMRDYPSAAKCLEKAQELSSHSIERLCLIAKASAEDGNTEKAEKLLGEAGEIDQKNQLVEKTGSLVTDIKELKSEAGALLTDCDASRALVSRQNTRAVIDVKGGNFDEGINLYERLLKTLPKGCTEAHLSISYNLSLALIKANKYKRALEVINSINLDKAEALMKKKCEQVKTKLKEAIAANKKIALKEAPSLPLADGAGLSSSDAIGGLNPKKVATASQLASDSFCLFEIYSLTPRSAQDAHKDIPKNTKLGA